MVIKKFRRKCDVRGCKNTANVYIISKYKDIGNSIAICTDCLNKAKALIDEKENVTLSSVAIKPEPVEVIEEKPTEDIDIVTEDAVTEPIVAPKKSGSKKNTKK
jgi:hypothetical protein